MLLVEAESGLLIRGHHCRGPGGEDESVNSTLTRHLLAENIHWADEVRQNFNIL